MCISCRNERLRAFHKDPDQRKKSRVRIQNKKVELIKYKGSICEHCNMEYSGSNACIFDFHHKNESEKSFSIADSMFKSITDIKAEVDKCLLVCSNCHREIHSMPY